MKNLKFTLLIVFAIVSTRLQGDIIVVEPNQGYVFVRVNNLDDFPETALIGLNDCLALPNANRAYRINSNTKIKVQKNCPVSLYTTSTKYLRKNDLKKIDWDHDKHVKKLNLTVKAKSLRLFGYSSVEIDYNLARYKENTLYLYKARITYKFRDERPDSVQFFKNDADPLKPISVSITNAG